VTGLVGPELAGFRHIGEAIVGLILAELPRTQACQTMEPSPSGMAV